MIKIALDAGHDLNTGGKRCDKSLDSAETREWVLNDRILDKVEQLLTGYDCEVLRTDDTTGKRYISTTKRATSANAFNADVFISMHHNAGAKLTAAGGTVIYYYSDSEERPAQAQALYHAITQQTGLIGNRASKISKKAYEVIKATTMPAFLVENGFMDSTTDTPIILTEEHANRTAIGVVSFLVDTFGLTKKESATTAKKYYRVQIGAFSSKENAAALQAELKSKGYPAIIKYC